MVIKEGFVETEHKTTATFSDRERKIYNRAMKHYRYSAESYRLNTVDGLEVIADNSDDEASHTC